jgi:hypothetical protein
MGDLIAGGVPRIGLGEAESGEAVIGDGIGHDLATGESGDDQHEGRVEVFGADW